MGPSMGKVISPAAAYAITQQDARRLFNTFKHKKKEVPRELAALAFRVAASDTSIYSNLPAGVVLAAAEKITVEKSPNRSLPIARHSVQSEAPYESTWFLKMPRRIGPSIFKKAGYAAMHALNFVVAATSSIHVATAPLAIAWGPKATLIASMVFFGGFIATKLASSWKKETQASLTYLADTIETVLSEVLRFQSRSAMSQPKPE